MLTSTGAAGEEGHGSPKVGRAEKTVSKPELQAEQETHEGEEVGSESTLLLLLCQSYEDHRTATVLPVVVLGVVVVS